MGWKGHQQVQRSGCPGIDISLLLTGRVSHVAYPLWLRRA